MKHVWKKLHTERLSEQAPFKKGLHMHKPNAHHISPHHTSTLEGAVVTTLRISSRRMDWNQEMLAEEEQYADQDR